MLQALSPHDRKKALLLATSACFIAASYGILRPLKISLFFQLVGEEYYPLSKILMLVVAIPTIAWYSKLVDFFKRHTILYISFTIYFFIGLTLATFLMYPSMGLANTQASPYRLLGWTYSVFMDFYPTFVIGTFWSFINSVSTPHFAKNGYAFIYSSIKIGSIVTTGLSFLLLHNATSTGNHTIVPGLIITASCATLISLLFIAKIIKSVPKENLLGYQAEQKQTVTTKKKTVLGMLEGMMFIVTKPYVFGTFLLFYFYEVLFAVVEYQATVMLAKTTTTVTSMSSVLFLCATISQVIGLALTIFATSTLLRKIPLQYTLMIMPTSILLLSTVLLLSPNLLTMLAAMTLFPAIHFSVNSPAREMLFIPTIREIQFKSKAWIDSFGRTISKSSGSTINMLFYQTSPSFFFSANAVLSLAITSAWALTAYFVGKSYEKTITSKTIIGEGETP
ncbi:hypothetical protein KKA53_03580 [Candidatus Dependentiae bacterium]|nr:hypothetical protein [Candidatus Dependentiae bacterium]